jgi:hypothetical protein
MFRLDCFSMYSLETALYLESEHSQTHCVMVMYLQ